MPKRKTVRRAAPPKLGFAGLIRVSTERQAKTGESLRTQRTQIEAAAKELGGKVVAWYGGQEHATPGWEKQEVDRLVADAQKKGRLWDGIVVADPDRWSRDNERSKAGLRIFRDHKVHFYVGNWEQDLFDPTTRFSLGVYAEVGEYQALMTKRKSLLSRIGKAKRGMAVAGKLPFGRTFDKETEKWGIDKKKHRIIKDVARRYLAGESLSDLAHEYGMNHPNLHKVLTARCGDTWEQQFNSDDLNIHEKVTVKIPRLLPAKTIRDILKKVEANKTYTHGHSKNKYLLSRMVFCEVCGRALTGQTNRNGQRYYRHIHTKHTAPCKALKGWARADDIEDAVLRHLFDAFGNPTAVEAAIQAAIPDLNRMRQFQDRASQLEQFIDKAQKGRQRVIGLVGRGQVTDEEAEKQLDELRQDIDRWKQERDQLGTALANVPTAGEVKEIGKQVTSSFKRVNKAFVRMDAGKNLANSNFGRMDWGEKRDLLQRVFSGKTVDGKRLGVYVSSTGGKQQDKTMRYAIKGHLTERTGVLPMPAEDATHLIDPDYSHGNLQEELSTKSASWRPDTCLPGCPTP